MPRAMPLVGLQVLLVEDAKDIRDVFALLLAAEGAEVVTASTGREAIEAATRRQFDVLLTDLGLPDVPGDVVIRQVVATTARRPRVVVVTGYDEPFISRARAAGADAILTKPLAWSVLLDRILPPRTTPVAA